MKRYIDCYVPVTTCTLRCHYCYITVHRKFDGPLPSFKYSPEQVRRALSKERLGGTCLINLCAGGETLLVPEITEYIRAFLEEGHHVMVVTNGTVTQRIKELASLPKELTALLFFKFSYHFLELRKRGLTEVFFNNIRTARDAGCSFTLEITPSDELIPHIDEVKQEALKNVGAIPHVTVARDERQPGSLPILTTLSRKDYIKTWSAFDSELFRYKMRLFGEKRKEFCYAGDWTFYLNLLSGEMTQCYKSHFSQNIFEKPDEPIRFMATGHCCLEPHCYNGHSYISFGDIPELEAPTYAEMRDRICADGSHWLKSDMRVFMASRLYSANPEYSGLKMLMTDILNVFSLLVRKCSNKVRSLISGK